MVILMLKPEQATALLLAAKIGSKNGFLRGVVGEQELEAALLLLQQGIPKKLIETTFIPLAEMDVP